MTKKAQLKANVEQVIWEYANGVNDCGEEEYPLLTETEAIKYAKDQIYDMKSDGCGWTVYREGVCDDLKFLGDEYIDEQILNEAYEAGIIKIE